MPSSTTNPSVSAVSQEAMQAVMNKDREAWIAAFSEDALLRDPVGGSPLDPEGRGLRGHEAMRRFWDAVVAPAHSVRFRVHQEFPSGDAVAKVATVEINYANAPTIEYDGVFVYEADRHGRIATLSGYFTPPV